MSKRIMTIVSIFLLAFIFTACTPAHMAAWEKLTPGQQATYVAQLNKSKSSRDCYEAIDKHFSGDKSRMRKIVKRESTNNPAAQNRSSSAAGCAQLLKLHAWRYERVGCSWGQRYDADCNIKAADHLYREQGFRPWSLTDY